MKRNYFILISLSFPPFSTKRCVVSLISSLTIPVRQSSVETFYLVITYVIPTTSIVSFRIVSLNLSQPLYSCTDTYKDHSTPSLFSEISWKEMWQNVLWVASIQIGYPFCSKECLWLLWQDSLDPIERTLYNELSVTKETKQCRYPSVSFSRVSDELLFWSDGFISSVPHPHTHTQI